MGFKGSAILSGIGKGLESFGTIGMQYVANSKLQADRMAAEEQRQLKLEELSSTKAAERLGMELKSVEGRSAAELALKKEEVGNTKAFQTETLAQGKTELGIKQSTQTATAEYQKSTAESNRIEANAARTRALALQNIGSGKVDTANKALDVKERTAAIASADKRLASLDKMIPNLTGKELATATEERQIINQRRESLLNGGTGGESLGAKDTPSLDQKSLSKDELTVATGKAKNFIKGMVKENAAEFDSPEARANAMALSQKRYGSMTPMIQAFAEHDEELRKARGLTVEQDDKRQSSLWRDTNKFLRGLVPLLSTITPTP